MESSLEGLKTLREKGEVARYERFLLFPQWVENTAGKGEIARHEQFLLFPQCFHNTSKTDT